MFFGLVTAAQSAPAGAPTPVETAAVATPKLDYPGSSSGLERLIKGIRKAQEPKEGARADSLLKCLVLRDAHKRYEQVFGENVGGEPEAQYEKSANAVPPTLARYLLNAAAQNRTEMSVVRFDKSCDDNAGEDSCGILDARLKAVLLYELRLIKGNEFLLLFAVAYALAVFATSSGVKWMESFSLHRCGTTRPLPNLPLS